MPRPAADGSTMKLAVPTWLPRPGRFGRIFAVPRTRSPSPSLSTTTVVRPGVDSNHRSAICASRSPLG